jgi:hypothetical protein
LFLAWLSQACHQTGEQSCILEKETGGEQNPRPGREPDVAAGGVEGGADLGARFTKAKG